MAYTIRLLVHFVKEGYALPDGIQPLSNFNPSFPQPPCSSPSDGNAAKDAMCGEYPAVKNASTETPASPRRSHEPELGSTAALAQHDDRGNHAKWPAHSFKKSEVGRQFAAFLDSWKKKKENKSSRKLALV